MSGFFTRQETASITRPNGKLLTCTSCGLYKNCANGKLEPYGQFKKKILVVGDAPSEVDDSRNMPWQGRLGRFLKNEFQRFGIDLYEDCLSTYAIRCVPKDEDGNMDIPSNYSIECCRRFLLQVIDEYKPIIVILLGQSATYSLIGHRWKKDFDNLSKWRGWTIPDQDFQAWLCPTFSPDFVEKADEDGAEYTIWRDDLSSAFALLKKDFLTYKEPEIEIISDLSVLSSIKNVMSFDYETTGIKPHAVGHRIVCASIADSEKHVFVFMMPGAPALRKPFVDLLINPNVAKIAHNMKYEHTWSKVRLRVDVQNWLWDTMLMCHIFDNRPKITSLKFQTYVNFGIVDYASEIEPYFATDRNAGDNALNKIQILLDRPGGKDMLLQYCALDSIYEFRLAKFQMDYSEQFCLPF